MSTFQCKSSVVSLKMGEPAHNLDSFTTLNLERCIYVLGSYDLNPTEIELIAHKLSKEDAFNLAVHLLSNLFNQIDDQNLASIGLAIHEAQNSNDLPF